MFELKDLVHFMQVYHQIETEAQKFLSLSAFAMKHKETKIKSAQATLGAIEEYQKLPAEIRQELEKDTHAHVSKIVELERLCRETVEKKN